MEKDDDDEAGAVSAITKAKAVNFPAPVHTPPLSAAPKVSSSPPSRFPNYPRSDSQFMRLLSLFLQKSRREKSLKQQRLEMEEISAEVDSEDEDDAGKMPVVKCNSDDDEEEEEAEEENGGRRGRDDLASGLDGEAKRSRSASTNARTRRKKEKRRSETATSKRSVSAHDAR